MILFIILFLTFILVTEITMRFLIGPILNSKIVEEALDYHIPNGIRFYDNHTLSLGESSNAMPFISTAWSLMSYYYIFNVGRVNRFSNAHKRIKELYLLKDDKKQSKLTRLKKKLNIN